MPEQHVDSDVYSRLLDDRHVDREIPGALELSRDKPPRQLRVPGEAAGDLTVEHCYTNWLKHTPPGRVWERRRGVLSLPGAQQISFPEELRAGAAADPDCPDQQSVEHQQSDAPWHDVGLVRVPVALWNPHGSGDAFLDCPVSVSDWYRLGQVRVLA
jgi:hypothetical protein